jgi:hypothetical protein
MWLQRWLGEAYSRLYWKYGRETFGAGDVRSLLGLTESMTHVALSRLHSAGALVIFDGGRPRRYRLLDPRSLSLLLADIGLKGTEDDARIPQERYAQLAYDTFRAVRSRFNLLSFAVYGSVARGEAGPSSDLDILLVSDDLKGSLASRIDDLLFADREAAEELEFMKRNGVTTTLSFLPLRREELGARPIVLLDLAENVRILYDGEDVLGGVLRGMRARLELAGARRVRTERGWYWDLKPDFRPGQEVVV